MSNDLHEVARIAAQLARQPVAQSMTLGEIAEDAVKLFKAARKIRDAETDAKAGKAKPAIETIANRYHARLEVPRDPLGMAVGLKFDGAPVSAGFRNVFFVA